MSLLRSLKLGATACEGPAHCGLLSAVVSVCVASATLRGIRSARGAHFATHHRVHRIKNKSTPVMSTTTALPSVALPAAGARGATKETAEKTRILHEIDGPLVWIDLEMTGLDVKKDGIMEIAVRYGSGDFG